MFTEAVSPGKFLIISIYGRKMLSDLNARVFEAEVRISAVIDYVAIGDRAIQECSRNLKVISKVLREQNTISVYLFLFS